MVVNVKGLGYIGLPTALMLASHGVQVVGTDRSEKLVQSLNEGKLTFEEKGLDELFQSARNAGIRFQTEDITADMYIVAVPTPYDYRTKKTDAKYVVAAVDEVLNICPKGSIIVVESTISPSTIDKNVRPLVAAHGLTIGEDVHLAHAPERIIPGNMLYELKHNSRTIGADSSEIAEKVKQVYGSFCEGEIVLTDIRTAEMTKVVENTFRDINIAFANELAKICRADNMDVYEVIRIANKHPRVNILTPGPGVGGHCISVDPWFLVGDYPDIADIIRAARRVNDGMPEFVLKRIYRVMKEKGIDDVGRVGLYGLTYKENVDDTRESPTLQMLHSMDEHLAGGRIKVYDPYVKQNIVPNQYHDMEQFLDAVDMVVILVGHDEIRENMDKLKDKVVLDTRNICHLDGVYKL